MEWSTIIAISVTESCCRDKSLKGQCHGIHWAFCFWASEKWRLLTQVSQTSDHDSLGSRGNSFAAQAESRKMSFSAVLPGGRHYFSPHKMADKNHWLSRHIGFDKYGKHGGQKHRITLPIDVNYFVQGLWVSICRIILHEVIGSCLEITLNEKGFGEWTKQRWI